MPVDRARIEEIFGEAVTKADSRERAQFLDQVCAGDAELRQRVEQLIDAHDATGNFLPLFEPNGVTSPYVPVSEGPKSKIGRYKLLEQIGEGGFGVVFMAEQEEPVRRLVALKIIKLGMDTRQVVARFEAERQALAMMDHPNVAKVLDGGATDTGRPYFVMELVKGIPTTEYCDQQQLSIPQRLELFSQVCQAVQHAHQKGLIHRDIKPTNVLVSTQDDRPVAKVIDFGVAKAMQARLTEKTLFTEFQQLVGTPAYMSPEQAGGSLDIDTRSDVYSLGVLLYELLTGSTPFDPKELRSKAFAELQRIIREEEPPKPSTRLSTSDSLPSIAANRHTEPAKLSKDVSGELDWIVMRSLEKDRQHRYQTASALAEDLQRYLADQPVEASPPSPVYRLKKFVRRNKGSVIAATVIVAALALGLVAVSYFAATASREAKHAERSLAAAEVSRRTADGVNKFFTEEVFGLADPKRHNRAGLTLIEALDIAASKIDQKFPDDLPLRAEIRDRFGEIYYGSGKPIKATEQLRKAIDLRRTLTGDNNPNLLKSQSNLGLALHGTNEWQEARTVLESTWKAQSRVLGAGDPETIETAARLSLILMEIRGVPAEWNDLPLIGDRDLEVPRTAYEAARSNLGPRHPATLKIENHLAWALRWRGELSEAVRYSGDAATGLSRVNGPDDVATLYARYNHACCLIGLRLYDEAETELREIIVIRDRVLGRTHIDTLYTKWRLVLLLALVGRESEAVEIIKSVHADLPEFKLRNGYLTAQRMQELALYSIRFHQYSLAKDFLGVADQLTATSDDMGGRLNYAMVLNAIASTQYAFPRSSKFNNGSRSIEQATKACELTNNENYRGLDTLAGAYLTIGDNAAALKVVRKSLALKPDDPTAMGYLSECELLAGNTQAYRANCAAMAKQLAASPTNQNRRHLAEICSLGNSALDNLSVPIKFGEELVAKNPKNLDHVATLGILKYRSGDYEKAKQLLSETVNSTYPEASEFVGARISARFFLAMTQWRLGHKDDGTTILTQAEKALEDESRTSNRNGQATLQLFRHEANELMRVPESTMPPTPAAQNPTPKP